MKTRSGSGVGLGVVGVRLKGKGKVTDGNNKLQLYSFN